MSGGPAPGSMVTIASRTEERTGTIRKRCSPEGAYDCAHPARLTTPRIEQFLTKGKRPDEGVVPFVCIYDDGAETYNSPVSGTVRHRIGSIEGAKPSNPSGRYPDG